MEIGDYVRTKYQGIKKIDKIFENATIYKYGYEFDDYEYETIRTDEIIKSSPNIIDLIEVGDIITYEFPTGLGKIKYENVTILPKLLEILQNSENNEEYHIKSVVTKEMYSSVEYSVETN